MIFCRPYTKHNLIDWLLRKLSVGFLVLLDYRPAPISRVAVNPTTGFQSVFIAGEPRPGAKFMFIYSPEYGNKLSFDAGLTWFRIPKSVNVPLKYIDGVIAL